ncbi:MAG TPA: YicC family protein [Bacillota bacterium]|nr:YicC family protein [Bacillota bacterium]
MIKSMTGYGRAKLLTGTKNVLAEVRSVNSRYLDVTVKLPRNLLALEEKVKQELSRYVTRAKVEIYISVEDTAGEKTELSVNREYLESYIGALGTIKSEYGAKGDLTLDLITQRSEVFIMRKADDDMDALWAAIRPALVQALDNYNAMRTREGENLRRDLCCRIENVESITEYLKSRSPDVTRERNDKLITRLTELLGDAKVDESRLLTECAIMADRQDVTEELTRLGSHIMQFRAILDEDIPVGRKLDFLVQEINREINTCGSKSSDVEIAKHVIEAKCELEKIREQIQNLE